MLKCVPCSCDIIKKELILQTEDALKIYEVDGAQIRDCLDVEFALGAHGRAKDYIPPDEVWIERVSDQCANLAHELKEFRLMRDEKKTYEEAHELASEYEKKIREVECQITPNV